MKKVFSYTFGIFSIVSVFTVNATITWSNFTPKDTTIQLYSSDTIIGPKIVGLGNKLFITKHSQAVYNLPAYVASLHANKITSKMSIEDIRSRSWLNTMSEEELENWKKITPEKEQEIIDRIYAGQHTWRDELPGEDMNIYALPADNFNYVMSNPQDVERFIKRNTSFAETQKQVGLWIVSNDGLWSFVEENKKISPDARIGIFEINGKRIVAVSQNDLSTAQK